jgi:hypothetical protein
MEQMKFLVAVDKKTEYVMQMVEQQTSLLNQIIEFLQVIARGGKLHEVNAYSYGRTSKGSAFILLYPAHPKMDHRICRVYEEKFNMLPESIKYTTIPKDAQDGNPNKSQARKAKAYFTIPLITVATEPGKDTNMGAEQRFMMILNANLLRYIPTDNIPAVSEPSSNSEEPSIDPEPIHVDTEISNEINNTKINPITSIDDLNNLLYGPQEEIIEKVKEEFKKEEKKEPDPEPPPQDPEPTQPYVYKDGDVVSSNAVVHKLFHAYWEVSEIHPQSATVLKEWYMTNKEWLAETKDISF